MTPQKLAELFHPRPQGAKDFSATDWRLAQKDAAIAIAAVMRVELEELAVNFEEAGPDAPWRGQEIADHIRERIKNHPALPEYDRGGAA